MYTTEELNKREKELKKSLRELGGLSELFPDISENYQTQIDNIKKIVKNQKTAEEHKSARFGKNARLKKEALAEIEEAQSKLSELIESQKELDKKIALHSTISKERTEELTKMVSSFELDKIKALPFEEITSCLLAELTLIEQLSAAEDKNEILIERHKRQQKEINRDFIEKLKSLDEYFIAFSPATKSPYMDLREQNGQACLWLFTKEEYAQNCRNFFARQYIFTTVVRVSKKDFAELAKNLPRLGFNFFTLNNGVHNLTIELTALTGKIQYSCPINPALHARRFDFFQALLLYNKVPQTNHKLYEQYHNPVLLKAKESVMLHELYKAKYTVVMRNVQQKNEKGENIETSEIPTNTKDNIRFLLIFTDMLEFTAWKNATNFNTDAPGFAAKVVDFATIDRMANDTQSELLIDRSNWCFEFLQKHREAAKQVAAQVEKLEAERKSKQKENNK